MLLGGMMRLRQGDLTAAVAHCGSGLWFFWFFRGKRLAKSGMGPGHRDLEEVV